LRFVTKLVRSYITKLEKVCGISLRFQPPNIITTHLHPFKIITRFPFYSLSFSQLPRLIILFLLEKLVRTNFLKIKLKIMSRERESPHDPNSPFKKKEKGGDGRSKAWWPMECSKVWWPMEGEGKTPFHLFPFPPQEILTRLSIFSFDFKIYSTMILGHYRPS
jgi:hypothetical protein